MSSMMFKHLPLSQWTSRHSEELKKEFDECGFDISGNIECPGCGGRGRYRDAYDELEFCDVCDGDGEVEKTYEDAYHDFCVEEYEKQRSVDLDKFYWYRGIIEQEKRDASTKSLN